MPRWATSPARAPDRARTRWSARIARARECAALVAYDGYPLADALRDCLALPLHAWDSAPELGARAARLAVDPPAADRS